MNNDITIVTACFNAADTLADTIQSVAAQSRAVEHIIVDGGSSDATVDIINRHQHLIAGFSSENDRGLYDAVNKGIGISNAGIVGILHADDVYAGDTIVEAVLDVFSDRNIDAVYGDLDYVDRTNPGKIVRRWRAGEFRSRNFYHGWMPPHPTFFVRRECYERHGLYRLDMGTAADYELMLRYLLVNQIRVKYIPQVLVKMRAGGASNSSITARLAANRMDRKAWYANGLKPYPWTLLAKPLRKLSQWQIPRA